MIRCSDSACILYKWEGGGGTGRNQDRYVSSHPAMPRINSISFTTVRWTGPPPSAMQSSAGVQGCMGGLAGIVWGNGAHYGNHWCQRMWECHCNHVKSFEYNHVLQPLPHLPDQDGFIFHKFKLEWDLGTERGGGAGGGRRMERGQVDVELPLTLHQLHCSILWQQCLRRAHRPWPCKVTQMRFQPKFDICQQDIWRV